LDTVVAIDTTDAERSRSMVTVVTVVTMDAIVTVVTIDAIVTVVIMDSG